MTEYAAEHEEAAGPQAVLRARALELARRQQQPAADEVALEILEFQLAHERYAIETRYVREVVALRALSRLPCVPAFIRGIVNVRGRITPVLDLKRFFDLPESGITDLHHVILAEGRGLEIGLLADSIAGVRVIARDALQAFLPTLTGIRADYLLGASADGLVALDARRILEDPRIVVDEEAGP